MATKLIIIAILLIVAFILSAGEVALYSLTSSKESLEGGIFSRLFKSPQLLLSTILVSNAAAVFLFSLTGASVAIDVANRFSFSKAIALSAEVVIFSGLLILFADSVPKIVASRNPGFVARAIMPLLVVLLLIESPIVLPLNSFLSRINRRRKKASLKIDNEGLKTLSELATTAGVMEENEAQLLKKISVLGEKTVRNAMTPRAEITSISDESGFAEVLEILKRCEHSRLPVYSGASENVVGMLYARDFLRVFRRKVARKRFQVSALMRKPVFVPETQSLERLIETFKENTVHIAVAVDEFGGLAGIITLSDVVREIFGSSAEEPRQSQRIARLSDSTFSIKGNARLDEIATEVEGFDAGEKTTETISSLLTAIHGYVPRLGNRTKLGNFEIEVKQATPKTILQVRLRRLNSLPVNDDEQD